MNEADKMLSEAIFRTIAAIEREKEAAGKMPAHAMYEDLISKMRDALNSLYSQGRIRVGNTINSKYITTKTANGNK